jgi:DNA polymerase-3 subunit epsilon
MLCSFDVESTGVNVESDRIVTACVAWIDGLGAGAPVIREWLVDPGIDIPEEAAKIHGITTGIAQAEGMSPAPVIAEICEELIRAADDQVPIVAFNACYDLTLLDRECRRNGLGPIGPVLDEAKALVIDPFVIDKQIDRFRKGSRTLTAVAAHYGVKQDTAHSASGDAITAARVAWRIAARNPHIARMGPTELHAFQVKARRDQARSYAEHLARQGTPKQVDGSWPWTPLTQAAVA